MKDNMNQELEKCKNDIIYFAENYLDVKIQKFQKEMLKRLEKSKKLKVKIYSNN